MNIDPQQIRNGAKDMCLDSSADTSATNKPVKMWPCHNQGGNQVYQHCDIWMYLQHLWNALDVLCFCFFFCDSLFIYVGFDVGWDEMHVQRACLCAMHLGWQFVTVLCLTDWFVLLQMLPHGNVMFAPHCFPDVYV